MCYLLIGSNLCAAAYFVYFGIVISRRFVKLNNLKDIAIWLGCPALFTLIALFNAWVIFSSSI